MIPEQTLEWAERVKRASTGETFDLWLVGMNCLDAMVDAVFESDTWPDRVLLGKEARGIFRPDGPPAVFGVPVVFVDY